MWQIELFSIGTELVLGQIQDTNAHWIAQQILQIGGELRRVTMLRDNAEEMSEALDSAVKRETSLILTTGGLGPTPDDMTVEVIASLIGTQPVVSEETISEFRKRREMSENDALSEALTKMATVPETAIVLQNPAGWAPCISVEHKASTIMMMPGPPREMKAIFETHIQPLIAERYRAEITTARVYVSMFEAEVSPLMQKSDGTPPRCLPKGIRFAPQSGRKHYASRFSFNKYGQSGCRDAIATRYRSFPRTCCCSRKTF